MGWTHNCKRKNAIIRIAACFVVLWTSNKQRQMVLGLFKFIGGDDET